MKKKIICNFNLYKQGHHIFYQNILFEKIGLFENQLTEYYFLFNNSSAINSLKKIHPNTIILNDEENANLEKYTHSVFKYFIRWKIALKYAKIIEADEVFFMDFYEPLLIPIFFSTFKFKISGIIFRPYNRVKEIAVSTKNIKEWINYFKKYLILKSAALKKKNIKSFLILHDQETVSYLNKQHPFEFRIFSDPINNNKKDDRSYNLRDKYEIDNNKSIILIFGALSPVKNIEALVDALISLSKEEIENYCLLIMGESIKTNKAFLSDVILICEKKIKNKHSNFKWILDYRFIEESEHSTIFQQVDIVYLAYKNFYFSSSTLGLAAKWGKPSIVPSNGPMEELAQKYNLGICVDPLNSIEIKEALIKMSNGVKPNIGNSRYSEFINSCSYENFTESILL